MPTIALIALGGNLPHPPHGGPADIVTAAACALGALPGTTLLRLSPLYRTKPLGPRQPSYVNAAALLETAMSPADLHHALHLIEAAFGRRRGRRWGPRSLDLDLIGYGATLYPDRRRWRMGQGRLLIPHVAAHRRAFVLRPLADVAPDWRHPALNRSVKQLLDRLPRQGMMRLRAVRRPLRGASPRGT